MARRRTYDEVKKEFEDEGYTLLSKEYIKSDAKLLVVCPNGHERWQARANFISGHRCRDCEWDARRNSPEKINKLLESIGYKWIGGEYIKAHEKIEIMCDKGHVFWSEWSILQQGGRCTECRMIEASERYRLPFERVLNEIELCGLEYLSGEYKNGDSVLTVRCSKHGEFKNSFVNIQKSKYSCPECSKEATAEFHRKDIDDVISSINDVDGYSYVSGKYKNNMSKLKVMCPKGHIFGVSWSNFSRGKRCPICKESKGEIRVRDFLKKSSIKFNRQKRFAGCKNKRELPFDFYLPDFDVLIEYQGRQHFKSYDFFGGQKAFEGTKKRDKIKRKFCRDNNIKLIEIKYTQFDDIEKILAKELGI